MVYIHPNPQYLPLPVGLGTSGMGIRRYSVLKTSGGGVVVVRILGLGGGCSCIYGKPNIFYKQEKILPKSSSQYRAPIRSRHRPQISPPILKSQKMFNGKAKFKKIITRNWGTSQIVPVKFYLSCLASASAARLIQYSAHPDPSYRRFFVSPERYWEGRLMCTVCTIHKPTKLEYEYCCESEELDWPEWRFRN